MSEMPIRPIGCRCMALDDPAWHSKECWIRQTDALRQQRDAFANELPMHSIAYKQRITALEQQLAAATAERDALGEWKQIILGTGTDQEAVIRLAATEYTKIAVESWRQQLAEARDRVTHAEFDRDHYELVKQQIVDIEKQLVQVIVERDAAETRNENYRMKLLASDSVIAQLSEHLAEDQAEIAWLQEKP